jgi:hypothetical protein
MYNFVFLFVILALIYIYNSKKRKRYIDKNITFKDWHRPKIVSLNKGNISCFFKENTKSKVTIFILSFDTSKYD